MDTLHVRTVMGADAVNSGELRQHPQWAFGYGAGWGNSVWGLYTYSGWGLTGATNYSSELEDSNSRTAQQNELTDSATRQQVA